MNKQKGFTLVELLVVIAIIGILSTVAVVNLNSARHKAKVASLEGSMKAMIPAIILCFNEGNDIYDGAGGVCDIFTNSGYWEPGALMCQSPAANWPNVWDIDNNITTSACDGDKDTGEFLFEATVPRAAAFGGGTTVTCSQDGCVVNNP